MLCKPSFQATPEMFNGPSKDMALSHMFFIQNSSAQMSE